MPRLPDDSPLLYPDNTGELVPREEWKRLAGEDCDHCGDDDALGYLRFAYGKHGVHETCDFICETCLRKSDAVDALFKAARRLAKSGTDEGAPFVDLVKQMELDYYVIPDKEPKEEG